MTTLSPMPIPARRSDYYNEIGDNFMDVSPLQGQHQPTPVARSEVYLCEALTTLLAGFLFLITLPFSLLFCLRTIKEYQRAVVFRLGRLRRRELRGPGLIFVLVCIDEVKIIDLRTIALDIPPQAALTRDSVTTTVDAVVYYSIFDPINTFMNVKNCSNSTKLLTMTMLRNVLGTKTLSELLTDRETISVTIRQQLEEATENWGVRIERVEITDVRLPEQLQKAMAAEAEAMRESRAKVIAAEGELRASRALKEASDVMRDNPVAVQLRYLQTLNGIASNRTSTIIFPVPTDFLKKGGGCS